MENQIPSPTAIIDEIFTKRLETTKELSNDFSKLAEYINPFLDGAEIQELVRRIESKLKIDLNIDDLVLLTAIHGMLIAREMITPKIPLKVECPKCKNMVYDFSNLEGIFGKPK